MAEAKALKEEAEAKALKVAEAVRAMAVDEEFRKTMISQYTEDAPEDLDNSAEARIVELVRDDASMWTKQVNFFTKMGETFQKFYAYKLKNYNEKRDSYHKPKVTENKYQHVVDYYTICNGFAEMAQEKLDLFKNYNAIIKESKKNGTLDTYYPSSTVWNKKPQGHMCIHKWRQLFYEIYHNERVGISTLKGDARKNIREHMCNLMLSSRNGYTSFTDYNNFVLMGGPGTGKTTLAMVIGHVYSKLGILLLDTPIVETKITEYIHAYTGMTAQETEKTLTKNLEKVIFIDEVYGMGGCAKGRKYKKSKNKEKEK